MNENTNLPPAGEISTAQEIKLDTKNILNIKALPFQSKARICWGFFWRSIVLAIGCGLSGALIGGIVGGIFGVILSLTGTSDANGLYLVHIVSGILGVLWGCFCFYFYIRWLLSSKFGKYRLLLVHAD